jgi:hypothetical protein
MKEQCPDLGGIFIYTDKTEINKIFFRLRESNGRDLILGQSTIATLKRMREHPEDLINEICTNISNAQAEFDRSYSVLKEKQEKLIGLRKLYHKLNGTTKDLVTDIDKIVTTGFFRLQCIEEYQKLNFRTTNDVIIREYNPTAGVDYAVNLGRFEIELDYFSGEIFVGKYSDNVEVNNFYHPHVSSDGKVCWGDAINSFYQYMNSLELSKVMNLLSQLLTSYNAGNPYVGLQRFKDAIKIREENGDDDEQNDVIEEDEHEEHEEDEDQEEQEPEENEDEHDR